MSDHDDMMKAVMKALEHLEGPVLVGQSSLAQAPRADDANINPNSPSRAAAGSGSDDYWDGEEEPCCPTCGGDGTAEYDDCPEAWGEDCPSEMNHLIICPNCRGSGLLKDCSSC